MKNIKDDNSKKEKVNKESIKKVLLNFCESLKDMPIAKNEEEQKKLNQIFDKIDELNDFMKKMIKNNTKK